MRTPPPPTKQEFVSLQFSPTTRDIYVTDIYGSIDRMNPDGTGFTTLISGSVLGRPWAPDDIAFDKSGAMFVTDLQGTPWAPPAESSAWTRTAPIRRYCMAGLAGANGISFDPTYSALWVSEFRAGREDYLPLSPDHTSVSNPSIAMYGNEGVGGFDSNAVDASGNVYQCVFGAGRVYVWSPRGVLRATISFHRQCRLRSCSPQPARREPGRLSRRRRGNGGFVYTFRARGVGRFPVQRRGWAGGSCQARPAFTDGVARFIPSTRSGFNPRAVPDRQAL